MKFLIDESVEKAIVDWLRDRKYDVMYIAESSSGITDEDEKFGSLGSPLLHGGYLGGKLFFRPA